MKISEFDYTLPKELIAQHPLKERDASRLLVLDKAKGTIRHKTFRDLPDYVASPDILVLNDTKVFPARLNGTRKSGGKVEVFLLEDLSEGVFRVLIKPAKKVKEGDLFVFGDGGLRCEVTKLDFSEKIIKFLSPSGTILQEKIAEVAEVPLPPYIKRRPDEKDSLRYQTIYAENEGSCAAPTAGLHFTDEVLNAIRSKGTAIAKLTLHVNYATFAPVKTEDVREHHMHREYYEISEEAAKTINSVRKAGGKVIAVGTTSARTLETCAFSNNGLSAIKAQKGFTDLFIYPPHQLKAVDMMLTNFHLPRSTLLMLVSAFAGKDLIMEAYEEAIREKYRFFSYGDAMLII